MLSARFRQTGSPAHPADHAGASRFPRAGQRHGRQLHHGDKRHRQRPQRQADRRPARALAHARQHIPAAAPGKPRVAGGIDRTAAIRPCNDGVRPPSAPPQHSMLSHSAAAVSSRSALISAAECPGQPGHLVRGGALKSVPLEGEAFFSVWSRSAAAFRPSASSTALPEKPSRSVFTSARVSAARAALWAV